MCVRSGVSLILSLWIGPQEAQALEPELDHAFGLEATRPLSNRVGTSVEAAWVDASIETKNTDSREIDQRYVGTVRAEGAYSPIASMGVRLFARSKYADLLRQDSLTADRRVREKTLRANGALDVSFAAAQGIEVFGGIAGVHLPKAKKTVELSSLRSETTYNSVTAYAPRLGLLKRTPLFAAGLFYSLMSEHERKYVVKTTGLEDETGKEKVTIPSSFGGMARFFLGSSTELELEFALVQLGESAEKTEQDAPYYRDYYRIRAGGLFPAFGTLSIYAALEHRTLSYNDQGFMMMDNIPLTALEFRVVTPGPIKLFAGSTLVYGQDSQSIPELNADFTFLSFSSKLGLELPM